MRDIVTRKDQEKLLDPLLKESHRTWPVGTRRWEIACGLITRAFRAGKRSGIEAGETQAFDEVHKWLVHDMAYPFDWSSDKPEWLDVRKLAGLWKEQEEAVTESVEDYMATIYADTGWDENDE